ncbi:MAG: LysM peptidoglycan-binding domain-containing protein [Chloroflexi bacterium]|nr:LysM peptidoglycan-binding domain-containing protein [Chloroflexota bacterium]
MKLSKALPSAALTASLILALALALSAPVTAARAQAQRTSTSVAAATATPAPEVHVVKRGETLGRIAAAYGVTVAQLLAANDISNANLIYVGQRLVVPGTVAATTTTAAESTGTSAPPGSPTPTRRPTASPTPTLRPIQATRTALARARAATATPSPTPAAAASACGATLERLLADLQERELPSGATVLAPADWTAREVAGLDGSLPYLSDKRMSAIIYLVSPGAGSVSDRLDLVPRLAGATGATELLRDIEAERGVLVWDARVGAAHRLVAGYVTREYTAVFIGSTVFCASTAKHSQAEAASVATLLQTVAQSYRSES